MFERSEEHNDDLPVPKNRGRDSQGGRGHSRVARFREHCDAESGEWKYTCRMSRKSFLRWSGLFPRSAVPSASWRRLTTTTCLGCKSRTKFLMWPRPFPWKGVPSASWRSMPRCPCKAETDSLGGQSHSPRAYFRAHREADCCGSREESKALRLSLVSELRQ